jgi:hypothetical protein
MNPTDWLPGMAAVLATTTSFLFSGSLLRRLLMESWTGPPALLATLTIAVSLMVVVSGALGVIGLLTRPALLVTALLVLAICVLISHKQKKDLWGGDRSGTPGRRVTAPVAIQAERVLARPGMTRERFEAILARQLPDAEKRRRADFVIDTGAGLEAARARVDEIVGMVLAPGWTPPRRGLPHGGKRSQ